MKRANNPAAPERGQVVGEVGKLSASGERGRWAYIFQCVDMGSQNLLWIIAFDKLWVSFLSSDGRLLLDEFDLQSRNLGQWC